MASLSLKTHASTNEEKKKVRAKGLAQPSLRPTTEDKSGHQMSFSVFNQFHQQVIDLQTNQMDRPIDRIRQHFNQALSIWQHLEETYCISLPRHLRSKNLPEVSRFHATLVHHLRSILVYKFFIIRILHVQGS